ncbi:MAG TPA: molecular chaperone DnaJ [Candidatus Krumholzibacteria bacterium]|nr:molecular chaperone DnaJ [Candidatus Krumholzibacteria bacterium]
MAAKRDYYEVLGIAKGADDGEIKRAYRKLAIQYHPDKNPDDPSAAEKFREATEAYEVLKDAQKRAQYDRFGHAGPESAFGGGGFGGGGFNVDLNDALESFLRNFGMGGFGDMFGGGGGGGGGRQRGRSLQLRLEVTLEEAAKGGTRTVKVNKQVACGECHGTGAKAGSRPTTCGQCRGTGRVRQVRQSLLGQMVTEGACPRCGGQGTIVEDPCGSCRGTGTVRGEEKLEIKVPAGVSSGNYMELEGKGDAGAHGAPAGNLRVMFEVEEHEQFERHGDDLLIDLPLSPIDLMLGTKVEVPTLDGKVALKIPAGTQSHKIFRMRGKGVPHVNRPGTGDQLVRVLAWTPERIDGNLKKKLEAVRDELAGKVPPPGRHLEP